MPYERSKERVGYRNGSYKRSVKTRVGHIELEVCRDRDGLFQSEIFVDINLVSRLWLYPW